MRHEKFLKEIIAPKSFESDGLLLKLKTIIKHM